ncbi:DUF4349 domain-containing protein [Agromyces bauzanensis]|uniref:DUF4349 domain-containing protein n=1 Tax=Agromyces bauzanensis TaxID=1308924 RepID=A0A917PUK2_9MICO|nr:DUF4349 domain-containing protein [Agromyces bauzanensis]GGJ93018.1 hypothetical protein GCM10011372_34430 [Agromyces bauzanensis]
MRRLAPAAAAAAMIALLFAGCTAGGSSDSGVPAVEAPSGGVAPEPGLDGEAAQEAVDDSADSQLTDRSVITTGWVSITVDDPIANAEDVAELTERAGGRVDNRSETPGTDTQPASASLTLRIPSDELDGVVDELRELGTVNSVSMNASDVTQQRQDLDARIDALSASVDRLRELLATATSITDLIAIESELTTRQAELDSLTQQRDWLVDQVDYSTLTVELVTEEVVPDPAPDDFWSGLVAGWNALVDFAKWLGIAVGVLLPWVGVLLAAAALIVAVVVVATRGRRHRTDAPTAETTTPEASRSDVSRA